MTNGDTLVEFLSAREKARAIALAADRAEPAEKAAAWFALYGGQVTGEGDGDVIWKPSFASSCHGSSEAARYIRKAIYLMLPTIVSEAESLANRDMTHLVALLRSDGDESAVHAPETPTPPHQEG